MRLLNDEMNEFLLQNLKGTGNAELTEIINKNFDTNFTIKQIKAYKKNHNLSSCLDGRFEKGHVPYNKGKKGIKYAGSEKGWFKKGHTPHNHKPVGSERVNVDGYIEIKISEPKKWRLKHNVVWEQANGKISKDKVVVFLDGNKLNLDISNLKLISRAELLIMNQYGLFHSDGELTDASTNLAKMIAVKNNVKNKKHKLEDIK